MEQNNLTTLFSGQNTEHFHISTRMMGLRGPDIHLIRRDIENMDHNGSPDEIWQNATFIPPKTTKPFKHSHLGFSPYRFRLFLDQDISLTEEDTGALYRSSAVLDAQQNFLDHFVTGQAVRIDLADNLERLRDFRPRSPIPIRSDIDDSSQRTVSLDHSYLSWMTSFTPDLHMSFTTGYLEEMYFGTGAEVLYRPFGKTYAFGAELYEAFKRDPDSTLNLGLTGDYLATGHLSAYYEIPQTNMTFKASAGRYLAQDLGSTLSLKHDFNHGASIEGFVTATDQADYDLFGSETHLHTGLKLSLPIGNIPYIPDGSAVRITAKQLGRDTGQKLETPVPLYSLTESLSKRHLGTHWHTIDD